MDFSVNLSEIRGVRLQKETVSYKSIPSSLAAGWNVENLPIKALIMASA
jgi:hypothetical protein